MVSNLPFSANQEDLETFFSQAGSVVNAKVRVEVLLHIAYRTLFYILVGTFDRFIILG